MSRAFIKEDDSNVSPRSCRNAAKPAPELCDSGWLGALQSQLAELQEQRRQLLEHPDAISPRSI